jgi:hypothetical protein
VFAAESGPLSSVDQVEQNAALRADGVLPIEAGEVAPSRGAHNRFHRSADEEGVRQPVQPSR